MNGGYSCMYCNKWYLYDDPAFVYYREFSQTHHLVRKGLVLAGTPMNRKDLGSSGFDTLGWFAHCRDKYDCNQNRQKNHDNLPYEQELLFDPIVGEAA